MTQNSTQHEAVDTSTEAASYSTKKQKYYALGLLTVVYSFNFIDRQLLSILQEGVKADLGLSDTQLGLLTGFSFAVFYVLAGIPIAKWADSGDRRNIISLATFIWSLMTALSGFVQNFFHLLLARIGVGVGEAGCSPPSHSIISDIFPPNARAGALGFYATGANIGVLFGFLLGGWLNELYGWRVAFIVVGAPGILLAIIVRMTLKEPLRGLSENRTSTEAAPTFKQVIALLFSRVSFRHIALASALTAFVSYSLATWSASLLIRNFGMETGELGAWLALIIGIGGAIGVFSGGVLADKLAKNDQRWYVWVPGLASLVALPFLISFCMATDKNIALLSLILPAFVGNIYLGCMVATIHGLVGLRMRAMTSAIFFLIINIIGLGLGPSSVGFVSDLLSGAHGDQSLSVAMLYLLPIVSFWSICHFYFASRHLRQDLDNAPQ